MAELSRNGLLKNFAKTWDLFDQPAVKSMFMP